MAVNNIMSLRPQLRPGREVGMSGCVDWSLCSITDETRKSQAQSNNKDLDLSTNGRSDRSVSSAGYTRFYWRFRKMNDGGGKWWKISPSNLKNISSEQSAAKPCNKPRPTYLSELITDNQAEQVRMAETFSKCSQQASLRNSAADQSWIDDRAAAIKILDWPFYSSFQ